MTMILYALCELKALRYWFRHYDEYKLVDGLSDETKQLRANVRWCIIEHHRIIR